MAEARAVIMEVLEYDALLRTAETYRRAVWDNQQAYVEVWLEKDALAGVLLEETKMWDVPLMVTRGYPSLSFLYEAAATIAGYQKRAYLYYFGDYDPSGMDISRAVEEGIREFAPHVDISFTRVAVTPDQILAWNLPTRPTKEKDSRSKQFTGERVEVDAIPPRTLRGLVREQITHHIDPHTLEVLTEVEAEERDLLERVACAMPHLRKHLR